MLLQVVFLVLALFFLYFGADRVIQSADRIGRLLRFSPQMIGLFIVGFCSNLPELFLSHQACRTFNAEIALGNIVGSNLINTFFIIAIVSLFVPLRINDKEVKIQLYFQLILSCIVALILTGNYYRWYYSIVPLAVFLSYLYLRFLEVKKLNIEKTIDEEEPEKLTTKIVLRLATGIIILYVGAELLIQSGSKIAMYLGAREYFVSLVFISFGTTFPILATSIVAIVKKRDIGLIVGNILGANIINFAFVFGSLGVYSVRLSYNFLFEILLIVCASIYFLILSKFEKNFSRTSGLLFLAIYAGLLFYWIKK